MQVSLFLVEGLWAHLSDLGVAEAMFSQLALSPARLAEGRARIELTTALRVGYAALHASRDPALALHSAERTPWSSFGMLGCLLMNCGSLHGALVELQRYFALLSDCGQLLVHDDGARLHVSFDLPPIDVRAERFATEYGFVMLARLAHEYLGRDGGLKAVHFRHAEPSYAREYGRLFGCEPLFEQARAELAFCAVRARQSRAFANARLWRALKEQADALLELETFGAPVHRRLSTLLKSDPGMWDAGPKRLGKLLGMSSRRLRRRLVSEGKSLSALIEDARLDRARYLLIETDAAIKSIAEDLGYSEPSAFHRAFKRWTGKTPAAFKRDQRTVILSF